MSGFYGGKQGRTYDIVERFSSISAMVTEFRKGNNYTDVLFGQYVIIDTDDGSDSTNGMIFRRGLNFNQDATSQGNDQTVKEWAISGVGGGAIYVGQIVGPEGRSITQLTVQGDYILAQFNDSVDPIKLGPIGSQYHVAGNYTINDILPGGSLYNGFSADTDPNKQGWLITILNNGNYEFYAFDYNGGNYEQTINGQDIQTHWYKINDFASAELTNLAIIAKQQNDETIYDIDTGSPALPNITGTETMAFIVTGGYDIIESDSEESEQQEGESE